eukprot:scpid26191/ scgid25082/ DEP domain-containing mTOR-interacting protein; DEP domain-containing protein 6
MSTCPRQAADSRYTMVSSENDFVSPDADLRSMDSGEVGDSGFYALLQANPGQAAEFFYLQLRRTDLVRQHRQKLRKYSNCFCSSEILSWLVSTGHLRTRAEALAAMKQLHSQGYISAVADDNKDFEDDDLLYHVWAPSQGKGKEESGMNLSKIKRQLSFLKKESGSIRLRNSVGRLPQWCCVTSLNPDTKTSDPALHRTAAIYFCYWLHRELHAMKMIRSRRWGLDSTVYPVCFIAKEVVSLLVNSKCTDTRAGAVAAMETLRDYNLVHHVVKEHHFKDEFLFFRFKCDSPSRKQSEINPELDSLNFLRAQNISVANALCTYEVQAHIGAQLLALANQHCKPVDNAGNSCYYDKNELVKAYLEQSGDEKPALVPRALERLRKYGLVDILEPSPGNDGIDVCTLQFTRKCNLQLRKSAGSSSTDGSSQDDSYLDCSMDGDDRWCLLFDMVTVSARIFATCYAAGLAESVQEAEGTIAFKAVNIVQCLVATDKLGDMSRTEAIGIMHYLYQYGLVISQNDLNIVADFADDDTLYTFRADAEARSCGIAGESEPNSLGEDYDPRSLSRRSSVTPAARRMSDVTTCIVDLPRLIPLPGNANTNLQRSEIVTLANALHLKWKADKIVKDRRYKFRVYPQCFIGKDVVDWLINEGYASNRLEGLAIMRSMEKEQLVGHVCTDHPFRDEMLFYRFSGEAAGRRSSGTFSESISPGISVGVNACRSLLRRTASSASMLSNESVYTTNSAFTSPLKSGISASSLKTAGDGDSSSLHASSSTDRPCNTDLLKPLQQDSTPADVVTSLGELLRLQLHNSEVVRSVRQGIHNYRSAFLAREVVDWLVDGQHAMTRSEASTMMTALVKHDVIHHVHDKHDFSDDNTVFRFRQDELSQQQDRPVSAASTAKPVDTAACDLYQRLCLHSTVMLKSRINLGRSYPSCVTGTELVNYLTRFHEDFVNQRPEAVAYCRDLHQSGVIAHVQGGQAFKDSSTLYFFAEDPEWVDGPVKANFGTIKRRTVSYNEHSAVKGQRALKQTFSTDAAGATTSSIRIQFRSTLVTGGGLDQPPPLPPTNSAVLPSIDILSTFSGDSYCDSIYESVSFRSKTVLSAESLTSETSKGALPSPSMYAKPTHLQNTSDNDLSCEDPEETSSLYEHLPSPRREGITAPEFVDEREDHTDLDFNHAGYLRPSEMLELYQKASAAESAAESGEYGTYQQASEIQGLEIEEPLYDSVKTK